jgi:hypothetical protein
MTLTALTRFISKRRRGEIFQVERNGAGGATVYFYCTDPKTGSTKHFAICCDNAEKIRVFPESFSKLAIKADSKTDDLRQTGKRRKVLSFDEMYVIGYGFQSIDVPVG